MACPSKSSLSKLIYWPGWTFFIFLILFIAAAMYAWENYIKDMIGGGA